MTMKTPDSHTNDPLLDRARRSIERGKDLLNLGKKLDNAAAEAMLTLNFTPDLNSLFENYFADEVTNKTKNIIDEELFKIVKNESKDINDEKVTFRLYIKTLLWRHFESLKVDEDEYVKTDRCKTISRRYYDFIRIVRKGVNEQQGI